MSMRRTEFFTTKTKIKKQNTEIMQFIPVSDEDLFIQSNPATHLDHLAWKYYGDAKLWWVIARANNMTSIIPNGSAIIRIPIGIKVSYHKE
jgi:hypothetical protein